MGLFLAAATWSCAAEDDCADHRFETEDGAVCFRELRPLPYDPGADRGIDEIHVVDLNQDGFLDVVVAANDLVVLLNDGERGFAEVHRSGLFGFSLELGATDGHSDIFAGDLDGDGDADVGYGLDVEKGPSGLALLENRGDRSFRRSSLEDVAAHSLGRLESAGGAAKLLVALPDEVRAYDSIFGSPTYVSVSAFLPPDRRVFARAATVDFTRDGLDDVVLLSGMDTTQVIAWDDASNAPAVEHVVLPFDCTNCVVTDIDRDGVLDFGNADRIYLRPPPGMPEPDPPRALQLDAPCIAENCTAASTMISRSGHDTYIVYSSSRSDQSEVPHCLGLAPLLPGSSKNPLTDARFGFANNVYGFLRDVDGDGTIDSVAFDGVRYGGPCDG